MGLKDSKPSQQMNNYTRDVTVYLPGTKIKVEINNEDITVAQFVADLNKKFSSRYPIVCLKSLDNLEILDYWLSLPEKHLYKLQCINEVLAVFYTPVPKKICCSTFEVIKLLGKGAFSIVTLVRKKDTGILYAMKSIEKDYALQESSVLQLLSEKEILSTIDHPFLSKMYWAFHTPSKFHIVMDYYPGGELFFHLRKVKRFTEDQARFYFIEVLLGIEYLHSKNIAYRDIKPENIVIDIDGHARITDFGLSKIGMHGISNSFCGSPEYMSPEMLRGQGHSKLVDFYCLGALLYEMLNGLPPFYDKDRQRMYDKILFEKLVIPDSVGKTAKSLLEGLLKKEPHLRLGKDKGTIEIFNHPWLENIDFDKYKEKLIDPPFVPNVLSSNIDKVYSDTKIDIGYFSDSEAEVDDIFSSIEYNVVPKVHSISQHYFEQSSKNLTINSNLRKPRQVHKINLSNEDCKDSISPYNSSTYSRSQTLKVSDADMNSPDMISSDECASPFNSDSLCMKKIDKGKKSEYGNQLSPNIQD